MAPATSGSSVQLGLVGLQAGEAVAVLEQRHQRAVGAVEDADPADLPQAGDGRRVRPADGLVPGAEDLRRGVELAGQPVPEDLELQGPDGSQDRRRVARVGVAQHLHDPFLVELLEAPPELLGPAGVERSGRGEDLGREAGDRRERHRRAVRGRPRRSCRRAAGPVALTSPTTSPGKASSTVSRSAPNAVVAYFVVSSRPLRSHVTVMPRSKRPEQMRAKARRSRCDGSMLAWTLNTNAENAASSGRGSPLMSTRAR